MFKHLFEMAALQQGQQLVPGLWPHQGLPAQTAQLETRLLTTAMHLRLAMHVFMYTYIKLERTDRKKYS